MTKSDVAQKYFPHITPHSAVNKLMSIITDDTVLAHQLRSLGYRPTQRFFSPAQLTAIFSRLGEP